MLRVSIEIIGWLAALLMLSAYLLLTAGRFNAHSRLYQWLNVLAGAGFIINSGWNGAYPSVFINVVGCSSDSTAYSVARLRPPRQQAKLDR